MSVYIGTMILVMLLGYMAETNREVVFNTLDKKVYIKNGKKYNFFVLWTAMCLILVAGLRWQVGTDYNSYARGYENTLLTVWESIKTLDEPGYKVLAWLSSFVYHDYASMFFVLAIFTVGLNVKTISKYSNDFLFGILLYMFIGAWHGSFNAVRQYAAAAILFCGHRYIYERKFWKYMLVVFGAFLFHRTALIMIPVYFLGRTKVNIKVTAVIVGTMLFFSYSLDYMFQIMSYYKGTDQTEYAYMTTEVNALRILVAFAPLLIIAILPKGFRKNTENAFYINMLIINATLMFATSSSAYLARVGIYTDIYATIAIPRLKNGFTEQSRKIFTAIVLLFYCMFWLYEIYARNNLSDFNWIFNR